MPLRTIDEFVMYRHASEGWPRACDVTSQPTLDELRAVAPEDSDELARLVDGAAHVADLNPNVARPPELAGMSDRLRDLWQLRHDIGTMVHFRKPLGVWVEEHLKSPRLRAVLLHLMLLKRRCCFFSSCSVTSHADGCHARLAAPRVSGMRSSITTGRSEVRNC